MWLGSSCVLLSKTVSLSQGFSLPRCIIVLPNLLSNTGLNLVMDKHLSKEKKFSSGPFIIFKSQVNASLKSAKLK